jgi:hypothetical protein
MVNNPSSGINRPYDRTRDLGAEELRACIEAFYRRAFGNCDQTR